MKSINASFKPSRAVGALAAVTVVLIALSVTFLLWDLRKRELEHARLDTISLTHMLREQTQESFDSVDLVLRGVQERMQARYGSTLPLDGPEVQLLLSARGSGMRQVSALSLLDAQGRVVNASRDDPTLRTPQSQRPYFAALAASKADGLVIDGPVRNPGNGAWSLHLARSFTGSDGKFRGIVVAAMNLPRFEQFYNLMKLDFVRPVALYLADGTLVASLPSRESMIGDVAPELAGETLPAPGDEVRIVRHLSGDGDLHMFALGRAGRFALLVSVTHDDEAALAAWRETAVPIALGAALVCIFIVIAAGVLMREVAREAMLARALRDANDRYHKTVDSMLDAIVAVDESHNVILFNPAAERMFGVTAAQALGAPLERLVPTRVGDTHHRHVDLFMQSDAVSRAMAPNVEATGVRADGSEFPIESTISQTLVDGKQQLTAVMRDVTLRRRAEAELREMNRQLRSLSASLQNVREQERTRISSELHDELGQQLTGLKLELSWLGGRLKDGRQPTTGELDGMRHQLDTAIASVRRIATELRPPILDDLGFGEAVAWQIAEFAKRSGLAVSVDLQAADRVTDEALATAVFRIVQESLTNVARHAAASKVEVTLVASGDELVLSIRDDGCGMVEGARHGNGIGLVSMRERATAFGGRIQVTGNPGMGTCIEVTLPLQTPVEEGEIA
jgi:PAS domain S-box-containing protein